MTPPSNLIIVEGAKNVGKTYLIENSGVPSYKFPFANYFNEFLKNNTDNVGTADDATYHFSTGFDISLLSLAKSGLVREPVIVDRGFLSNIVLGQTQNRITDEDAYAYIDFLHSNEYLGANLRVIYIQRRSSNTSGGRTEDKDQWEYLDYNKMNDKYHQYIGYLWEKYKFKCEIFYNDFDNESLYEFKYMCTYATLG